ncbi:sarcosine oxidase subunit gamma [Paeniglutamicibacter cryotolerans]|uniref:Sarcosine oxidase subunit gamma n=1 Tax=Paeniglutamicibacter cryotolerans TaxID=670079 RepID=A0A839QIQ1_9MICC|nr:sarcosine oxidase subunit gamma family protein [Paeniglutamicibacter cryotolerans]MBB2995483.1 sarcosine oxidase subunit gamma [Paeniglutamicibacter cryotolerans]
MAEQVLDDISVLRRSPLAHRTTELAAAGLEAVVSLRELVFMEMTGLRADPGSDAHTALAAATGVGLPGSVGQVAGDASGIAVLWQGPDEFLLIAPDGTGSAGPLTEALGNEPGAVVDLSANRTTLELSGPKSRDVLEKGCPADLHPRSFAVGTAISTTLGPVPVLLWRTAPDTFRILPRASFADYTAHWLLDAMVEYTAAG